LALAAAATRSRVARCPRTWWSGAGTGFRLAARDDLSNGLLLLKQAEEACDENGDAGITGRCLSANLARAIRSTRSGRRGTQRPSPQKREDPSTRHTGARRRSGGARQPAPGSTAHATRDTHQPAVSNKWASSRASANSTTRASISNTRARCPGGADLLRDPTYGRFRADHVRLIADSEPRRSTSAPPQLAGAQRHEDDLAVIYIALTARRVSRTRGQLRGAYDTDVDSLDACIPPLFPW